MVVLVLAAVDRFCSGSDTWEEEVTIRSSSSSSSSSSSRRDRIDHFY